MKPGQIGLVNLKLKGKKTHELKEVIFSIPYKDDRSVLKWSLVDDRRIIKKVSKNEDLIVLEIELIKPLGWKHKNKSYYEVKKSEEQRNKITGAYE